MNYPEILKSICRVFMQLNDEVLIIKSFYQRNWQELFKNKVEAKRIQNCDVKVDGNIQKTEKNISFYVSKLSKVFSNNMLLNSF